MVSSAEETTFQGHGLIFCRRWAQRGTLGETGAKSVVIVPGERGKGGATD